MQTVISSDGWLDVFDCCLLLPNFLHPLMDWLEKEASRNFASPFQVSGYEVVQ